MWIRPSMPSRSTKAPKSTMFEIDAVHDHGPSSSVSRIRWRTSRRSSSSTARRESTTLLRERLSSITRQRSVLCEVLVQVLHAPDVDQRGGQEAAHPEVEDEAALDDLDDHAVDRLAALGRSLDALPRLLEAGALLREDEAAVRVLLLHDEGVDLVTEGHLLVGIHVPANRQLGDRDDAFGLVADVDEDLVLVDPDDLARHHVALAERRERAVVVGDELAVDFRPHPRLGGDDLGVGLGHWSVDSSPGHLAPASGRPFGRHPDGLRAHANRARERPRTA